ncbi:MAG: hypothetical protein K2W95_30755 [Candidatus Obscuribacterales bacterium]|nr:hypothetical protein [Candidatus Obscuribacterales bacterium]
MFHDEQDDTYVDLSAHSILWTRFMQLGKEHLAANDHGEAIKLFTLAENTVSRTKDLVRQTESLSWLIMAYSKMKNAAAAEPLLEKLMTVVDEMEAKRFNQPEQRLHAIALRAELKCKFNEAEAAYSWLLASYQQRGLHSADPEVNIMLQKCTDMNVMQQQYQRNQPLMALN